MSRQPTKKFKGADMTAFKAGASTGVVRVRAAGRGYLDDDANVIALKDKVISYMRTQYNPLPLGVVLR